ncbi:Na/Pi cotransporter family protein [Anaerolentibacter hominis]|uniref:Na/Pi cotransporter family protein n=1 Tax=Anaerolentibacter hominis TaxID=3079009 RepID=UPI0031B7F14F
MSLTSILTLMGGIGLFLYGMKVLGSSLEKLAGASLERILERLTSNRLKGVALGAVVTAVIQSSAATSVMVVGFVNAGIMKLVQAVPVVMGANIGTTITAQILRLGDISSDNIFMMLLKPASFAPVCVCIGAFILLVAKKAKTKNIASIVIGFGILFVGMSTMETALAPLRDSEAFHQIFFIFKNPLLGVLLGAVVTAILQSSSASVGVLQAVSSTGSVTFSMAAPIIMGQNIGKCITVLIASIGTNKKAKRVVAINVLNNIIGVILMMVVIYGYQALFGFSFWDSVINRGGIANFHTLFNLVTTFVLLPFCNLLIHMSGLIIRDHEVSKIDEELALLDSRFIPTPAVALEQCKKVILSMGQAARENFEIASGLLEKYDEKQMELLQENEKFLDKSETVLGEYLVKITAQDIRPEDSKQATEIMHTVGDLERIGDYCVNVAEVGEFNSSQNLVFSDVAREELHYVVGAVDNILKMTMDAYETEDKLTAQRVEPLEETIDILNETLRSRHVQRLQTGECETQRGISFIEVLTNVERISDHCSNIAIHLIQRISKEELDTHEQLNKIHQGETEEYKALCRYYESLYCDPIR